MMSNTPASPAPQNWFGAASPGARSGGVSASMSKLLIQAEGGDGSEDFKVGCVRQSMLCVFFNFERCVFGIAGSYFFCRLDAGFFFTRTFVGEGTILFEQTWLSTRFRFVVKKS